MSTFLFVLALIVFGQTLRHDFIDYDDPVYVRDNPPVASGLTLDGLRWAFTHVHSSNWHPLTWISHMLDCQLYGLNPAGHHLTNVLLHAATGIVLFLALRRLTGFLWRSAFVAAVFTIHPLRVESVAWVAERKDVLSGLFFMLSIAAYARYAAVASGAASATERARRLRSYGWVVLFFILGLLSKPMVVTLPLVLLLLDFWPLKRVGTTGTRVGLAPLVREKIPLFMLSAAASVVTLFAQHTARLAGDDVPLALRVGNALISSTTYIRQLFWPSGLAVLYRFLPKNVGSAEIVLSALALVGLSIAAWVWRGRRPYILVGWSWYLIMLLPVCGIVWVGTQAHADRYTYLPQIGLYVMLTWLAVELSAVALQWRRLLQVGSAVILVTLAACARVQASYSRDSETLWTHALACTSENVVAHNNLGNALTRKGELDEAITHYETAVRLKPDYAEAHYNLAGALLKRNAVDEAIAHYETALRVDPTYVDAHNNLGNALLRKGRTDEAIAEYQRAVALEPSVAIGHVNLGNAFARANRFTEARAEYCESLRLDPNIAEAHFNLSKILLQKGDEQEAFAHYQRAIELKPELAATLHRANP